MLSFFDVEFINVTAPSWFGLMEEDCDYLYGQGIIAIDYVDSYFFHLA
jgi:hypothetical protein